MPKFCFLFYVLLFSDFFLLFLSVEALLGLDNLQISMFSFPLPSEPERQMLVSEKQTVVIESPVESG